jgi:hypothetical protein
MTTLLVLRDTYLMTDIVVGMYQVTSLIWVGQDNCMLSDSRNHSMSSLLTDEVMSTLRRVSVRLVSAMR